MSELAERIADGAYADDAMTRLIAPALTLLREDYSRKAMDLLRQGLMEPARLIGAQRLSIALGVIDQVEAQIKGVIADGKLARRDHDRASEIARVSAAEARRAA